MNPHEQQAPSRADHREDAGAPGRPQPGIFALGVPEHCYLEFDLDPGSGGAEMVRRDALTRYTTALSGAYYLVPSVSALARFVPDGTRV